jgi:hypothetical protein
MNSHNTATSWIDTRNTNNQKQRQQQQPFNEHGIASKTTKLIIVAGHSVIVSGQHLQDANHDESDWYLLEYQKHHGLPEAILGHITAGIQSAQQDAATLLIFSGGQTRAAIGPESEGSSYYRVADVMNLWSPSIPHTTTTSTATSTAGGKQQYIRGHSNLHNKEMTSNDLPDDPSRTVRARTITEEYATDSFQNLLFSICRFYEITSTYPTDITMISDTFKQHRFESLHVPALRWPQQQFHYIDVDPPSSSGFDLQESIQGEMENAARPFEHDPYGCHSTILQEKRLQRNPFFRTPPYDITCPDMVKLMHFCGQTIIDERHVPWIQPNER